MGLGAFPASRPAMARHAGHARHLRGQPCDARLRPDDLPRRALRRPRHRPARRLLAGSKKIHVDIDPSSINKNVRGRPAASSAMRGQVLRATDRGLEGRRRAADRAGAGDMVERRSTAGARKTASLRASQAADAIIKPQYAIERLYELTRKGRETYHHHRGRPAPDVGGAALPLRGAEPLDDLGRPRHHGLWPAGRDGRADRASRRAGHRHRRRSLDPDEHPGDVDRGAVSTCRSRSSS